MTIKNIELNDLKTADFSVDLLVQGKKHLTFLHALHKLGIITQYLEYSTLHESIHGLVKFLNKFDVSPITVRGDDQAFLDESVRRYSELWLPLVAEAHRRQQVDLIPPPDIAWMWHCHRLAPYRYTEHVEVLFGDASVDASHPFVFQIDTDTKVNCNDTWPQYESETYQETAKATRDLFYELYPGESFYGAGPESKERVGKLSSSRFLSGYDLISACQRQATFLWQVSGKEFSDDGFLREGIENYRRFVKLTNHPQRHFGGSTKMWLVPTYQIDWFWHTHILSNIQGYDTDAKNITGGAILDHDDSLNDRTEGGVLDTSFQQTTELWKQVYDLEYVVPGGMYRGEPPVEFYSKTWIDPDCKRLVHNIHHTTQAAPPFAEQWMPDDHPDGFIPMKSYKRGRDNPYLVNTYKDGYVFGAGDKGLGYYNLNLRQANGVLMDRCERKIGFWKFRVTLLTGILVFFHALSLLVFGKPMIQTTAQPEMYFDLVVYVVFCVVIIPWFVFSKHLEVRGCEKILQVAKCRNSNDADAMEGGGYNLYTQALTPKDFVGAAACGFDGVYGGGPPRRSTERGQDATCGGGSCGFSGHGHHGGADSGGAACSGGGCGGGGCGG